MALGSLENLTHTAREAAAMFKRAYELDPLSLSAAEMLASAARWSGDDALAAEVLARMNKIEPDGAKSYLITADHLMERGEFREAQRMLDLAKSADPDEPMTFVSQSLLSALMGKKTEAEEGLKQIPDTSKGFFRLTGAFAVNTALGNLDKAFETLERLAEAHCWPATIRVDPLYPELRRDPRFAEFCSRVGIRP
jgi:tetratricopeptide (TPR) repeat protein